MVMNSELKRNARAQLGGNIFASGWLMMLLACLIVSLIEGLGAYTVIISLLTIGPLSYGLMRCMVNVIEGKNKAAEINDLFCGFSENFTNSFLLGLITEIFIALWSLLFVIPGIVKAYSYSMAPYIQQKESNKEWKYCLDRSIAMMDGQKSQLFVLDLSFIGWYLLGSICLGIGIFFVLPYHQMARANFFEALYATNAPAESVKPDEVTAA